MGRAFASCAVVVAAMMAADGARADNDTEPRARFERRPQNVTVTHDARGPVPIWGPRHAPVTIELFFNLVGSSQHRRVYDRLLALSAKHPRRLRIIFRLEDRSRGSGYTEEAAMEAFAQGRFVDFVDAIHNVRRRPSREQVEHVAEAIGLDIDRVKRSLLDRTHQQVLRDNTHYRARRRLTKGLPAVIFNGHEPSRRASQLTPRDLDKEYHSAYERAKDLLASGVPRSKLYHASLRQIDAARPPPVINKSLVDSPGRRGSRDPRPPRLLRKPLPMQGAHSRGPANAKVVVAMFCSFQSQNCARMAYSMDLIRKEYPDEVRFVFNHLFDDNDANQPSVRIAHEASLCAEDQGSFWAFYDQHYRYRTGRRSRQLQQRELKALATRIGIGPDEFITCIDEGRHAAEVQRALQAVQSAGITRTPSIVIGGRVYEGTRGPNDLRALVADQLRPGLLEEFAPVELEDR